MLIANPIYDVVFKRLMENERVVRFLIGTILNQTVVEVKVKPQEFTRLDKEVGGVSIFRLDFIATIKTEKGELKNVLIEIQKAWNSIDLMRFRNYIAEQYRRKDRVDGKEVPLPIVTIYILGFDLPDLPFPYTEVIRQYRDINKEPIPYTNNFIENLTHDSYVVQVGRINGRHHTRIEKLLSLFEQTNFQGGEKITKEYNHPADVEELEIMIDILHQAGTNPKELKEIEEEQEAWRTLNALRADERESFDKALNEKDKVIEEKDKALEEKDKENEETKKALEEKDKENEETKKALEENKKMIEEMARQLEELKRNHGKK